MLIVGAGAGVGLACARAFAERGAELMLSDIDGPALKRATQEIGGNGIFCDVASEASVAIFAAEVQRSFGSLDVLINAAGKSYVRTLGTMRVSRALLPMLRRDGGRKDIVNVAHMSAGADPGPFPYAASTEAFACLADALAENVRGTNVVLTTIMPRALAAADSGPGTSNPAPMQSLPSRRQFHCEISDRDSFAEKIASAVHAPRAGRYDRPPAHRSAPDPALRRVGSSGC